MERKNEIQGMISDIQSFSLHDGPGIRTSVFLKGCPLRCIWCHNPETVQMRPQPSKIMARCVSCGHCREVCPVGNIGEDGLFKDSEKCISCGRCAQECPQQAISMTGTEMTAMQAAQTAVRDRIFFEHSGGGVTVTGGEPLLQPQFTYSLLSILKEEGIHTAVETCGFAAESVLSEIAGVTDLFLFDYKETDDGLHKEWTGVDREQIRKNLQLLAGLDARVILRCPVIPGLNDRPDHFEGIARTACIMPNIEYVELMPYHNIGLDKAKRMGIHRRSDFRVPEREETLSWKEAVIRAGYEKVRVSSLNP